MEIGLTGAILAASGKEEFCRPLFIILQRWLSITFTDNFTNLGGILSGPVAFFVFTDLSSGLMSETVASCIVSFSTMLMFFLISAN